MAVRAERRPLPGSCHSLSKVATAPVDVGISDHTDFEVFTIMHQQSAGLHLHTPSRGPSPRWYQPPLRPDTLTVILGVSGALKDFRGPPVAARVPVRQRN